MIDLHIHTTYSDGHSTVEEVVNEVQEKNISLFSITDHNTVDAYYDKALENVEKYLTGVEITTTYNGEVIEVLGYNFNLDMMKELLSKNVLTFEQK